MVPLWLPVCRNTDSESSSFIRSSDSYCFSGYQVIQSVFGELLISQRLLCCLEQGCLDVIGFTTIFCRPSFHQSSASVPFGLFYCFVPKSKIAIKMGSFQAFERLCFFQAKYIQKRTIHQSYEKTFR